MPVQIFKPSPEAIAEMAARARAAADKQGGGGGDDITWGNFKNGDNHIRVLPSASSHGIPAKRVHVHDFRYGLNGQLKELLGKATFRCTALSHPEVEGIVCPFHQVGDQIKAVNPVAKIGWWHSPKWVDYVQAFLRADPDLQVAVYKLTPGAANDFWIQYDRYMQHAQIDICDAERGMDIIVSRNVSKVMRNGRSTDQIRYKCDVWNVNGPTPVHNDPATQERVLSQLKSLDELFKFPSDEQLAKAHEAAVKLLHFYTHQAAMATQPVQTQVQAPVAYAQPQQPSATPSVPPSMMPPPQGSSPYVVGTMPQQPVQPQQQPQQQPVQPQQQPQQATPPQQPQQTVVTQGQTPQSPPQVPQTQSQLPFETPAPQAQPASSAAPSSSDVQSIQAAVQKRTPMDLPECFGGAAPRKDGQTGYSMESEECLICPFDAQCQDACTPAA